MPSFSVTYAIILDSEPGEEPEEERGYVLESACLRDAARAVVGTRTSRVDGTMVVECDSAPAVRPRWVTASHGMEYETGAYESRSLHIPATVTPASARRIARLLGAYGVAP